MVITRPLLLMTIGVLVLLTGCLSGAEIGQTHSPTTSPTATISPQQTAGEPPTPDPPKAESPQTSVAPCATNVAFYGLRNPEQTGWAADRISIGYTVQRNASVFFVAFEEGTVIGTIHVTTEDLEYGVTADGDSIPLERRFTGSKMIRVGAYADTNDDGQFDFGDDMPCQSNGQPVEAGPRRINFSSLANATDSPTPSAMAPTKGGTGIAYEA